MPASESENQAPTLLSELSGSPAPEEELPIRSAEPEHKYTLQKLSHRHHAIMDYLLSHPIERMDAIATRFKVTPAWLSSLRNSDLFKEQFAQRRRMMDEDQSDRIAYLLGETAEDGIGAMRDIIKDTEQEGRLKLDATKVALEAIGFLGKGAGASGGANPQTNIQVNVDGNAFAEARALALQGSKALPLAEGGQG